jgi:hypothetical protein
MTHDLWAINGSVVELVEQEGNDMRGVHVMLWPIRDFAIAIAFPFFDFLCTSEVECLCNGATILLSESDLK